MKVSFGLSSVQQRAALVHAYVSKRHYRFTREQARHLVDSLSAHWGSPIGALAKLVDDQLAPVGIRLKHASLLQVASRVQGHSSYHEAPKPQYPLELLVHGDGARMQPIAGWRVCAGSLTQACLRWLDAHPQGSLVVLDLTPTGLAVHGVPQRQGEKGGRYEPIALVCPRHAGDWLAGAAAALEMLRRTVEEVRGTILDGLAVVRFCAREPQGARNWPHASVPSDAPHAELVLLEQTYEDVPGNELMRGNEVACWHQLSHELEDVALADIQVDEVGAWFAGGKRFAWEVVTVRPHDVIPGMMRSNLPTGESTRLLRRFKNACRANPGRAFPADLAKRLPALDGPPDACRLNAHRVLHALNAQGETWDEYCASIGEAPFPLSKPVEFGFFMSLADHLKHANPNSLLALPPRGELTRVDDDHLLRALLPRVHHVRYRCSGSIDAPTRATVGEAIADFSAALAIRHGALPMEKPLPPAVFGADAEELRQTLADLNLVMFVGVLPHLLPIPEDLRKQWPQMSPYAFGYSLFIDIDHVAA